MKDPNEVTGKINIGRKTTERKEGRPLARKRLTKKGNYPQRKRSNRTRKSTGSWKKKWNAFRRKIRQQKWWQFLSNHKTAFKLVGRPLLLILVCIMVWTTVYRYQQNTPCGIDVSSHQGFINWLEVKYDRTEFAIIRAGVTTWDNGNLKEDERFNHNFSACGRLNIDRGVYYYSQAITPEEAVQEANLVLKMVDGRECQLPIYIDVEDTGTGGKGRADQLTKAERTAVVKAFCETIEAAGYRAGVYSNASFFTNNLNVSELKSYSFWVAAYSTTMPAYLPMTYDIWQYTDSGSIQGIEGSVDLNRYSVFKSNTTSSSVTGN